MAEAFVELGAEGINKLTDKYYDRAYDRVITKRKKPDGRTTEIKEEIQPQLSTVSGGGQRRQKNRLPSPEGDVHNQRDRDFYSSENTANARRRRDPSLERQSYTSERVIDDYESERTDPVRKPESVLSKRDLNTLRRDSKVGSKGMSYYANDRPRSQQPPRSRYGYDDEDSDYDEHTGRRSNANGRGYDDRHDDRGYDREIVETERYRGPPRNDSYRTSRNYDSYNNNNNGAGAGAVTQYNRRSGGEVADYDNTRSRRSGRSRSRGRRDRSYSSSRSRSRSRSKSGIRGKLEENFDTSMRGLGVGLAGAVAGGFAGKQFGGKKNKERDMIIGAIVGGLGANAAETKYRDWRDEKEKRDDRAYGYGGRGDIGRSRSAMR